VIDERSEAIGYTEYYAMAEGRKGGKAEDKAAVRWLLQTWAEESWHDSFAVIEETLVGMGAPQLVRDVLAELVDLESES
jgi:hypothetical protein